MDMEEIFDSSKELLDTGEKDDKEIEESTESASETKIIDTSSISLK